MGGVPAHFSVLLGSVAVGIGESVGDGLGIGRRGSAAAEEILVAQRLGRGVGFVQVHTFGMEEALAGEGSELFLGSLHSAGLGQGLGTGDMEAYFLIGDSFLVQLHFGAAGKDHQGHQEVCFKFFHSIFRVFIQYTWDYSGPYSKPQ